MCLPHRGSASQGPCLPSSGSCSTQKHTQRPKENKKKDIAKYHECFICSISADAGMNIWPLNIKLIFRSTVSSLTIFTSFHVAYSPLLKLLQQNITRNLDSCNLVNPCIGMSHQLNSEIQRCRMLDNSFHIL